jgi:hypothetical protein
MVPDVMPFGRGDERLGTVVRHRDYVPAGWCRSRAVTASAPKCLQRSSDRDRHYPTGAFGGIFLPEADAERRGQDRWRIRTKSVSETATRGLPAAIAKVLLMAAPTT